MSSLSPHRLAPAVAILSVLAACGGGAPDEATPTASTNADEDRGSMSMSDDPMSAEPMSAEPMSAEPMTDPMSADTASDGEPAGTAASPASDDGEISAARLRCRGVGALLEQRMEAEDFEWPDEGPELSEEDLDRVMAPEYVHVDGVASPDERAMIELIPPFDPQTVPIPELDRLAMVCIESDIATMDEVYGEDEFLDDADHGDDEDEFVDDEDDGDDGWCEELASMSADQIAEFAAEDGADVVSEEFAECDLADPFSS
ncbi:MAG: hypothetical protein AAGF91_03940 [Actinomycetota bacterium]